MRRAELRELEPRCSSRNIRQARSGRQEQLGHRALSAVWSLLYHGQVNTDGISRDPRCTHSGRRGAGDGGSNQDGMKEQSRRDGVSPRPGGPERCGKGFEHGDSSRDPSARYNPQLVSSWSRGDKTMSAR